MLPEEATETQDKDIVYMRRFDKMQRDYLKTLVSPEVIDGTPEVSARPAQRGASAAAHLLPRATASRQVCDHVRRGEQGLSHRRAVRTSGRAAALVEDKIYPTPKDAFHGVFMRRVQDLLES